MKLLTASRIIRELMDFVDPDDRRRHAGQRFAEVSRQAEPRVERADEQLAKYKRLRKAVLPTVGAILLLTVVLPPVDVPLQAIVGWVSFPGFSRTLYVAFGLAAVLFIAAIIHGWVYTQVDDPARPLHAPRVAAFWGTSFLIIFMGTAAIGFATSRVWDPDLAGRFRGITQLSVLAAAELGAIAGGFLGAAAWPGVRAWFVRRRLMRLRDQLRQLLASGDLLAGELGDETVQVWAVQRAEIVRVIVEIQQTIGNPGLRIGGAVARTIIALAVAGALNSACMIAPPTESVEMAVAKVQAATPEPAPAGRMCGLLVDGSRSLDAEHRPRAVNLFVQQVEDLIRLFDCGTVAAGVFADGGEWTGSLDYVSLPAFSDTVDCNEVQPEVKGFDRLMARNPAYRESLERDARHECENRQAQTQAALMADFEPALARISTALQAPAAGDATDLAGAIRAVLRPGGIVFVLTDGIQTVRRSGPFVVPPEARVVLVIVPTAAKYGGAKATRERAEAWQEVDGMLVFPYPMLGERGFIEKVVRTVNDHG